jgi:outer membrane protein assembly factor BamB
MGGAVFVATGNGKFDANAGGDNYGDSVIGLNADVSSVLGYYTPRDYARLDSGDIDLGSTSPALLPRLSGSRTPLTLVQGGKDAILRLVDRAPLRGVGHELQEIRLPTQLFATPAVWSSGNRTRVFIALPDEVEAFAVTIGSNGATQLRGVWRSRAGHTAGEGTSPVVSNGIVFVAFDGAIVALSARTGRLLWSSAQPSAMRTIGPVHWESPIVVDGVVYCSDEDGRLTAYGL